MANFTITGNVGGTAGSGATIQLINTNGTASQLGAADSSGNFTFTVADLTNYKLVASLSGKSIRQSHQVNVNGSNVSGINFQVFNLTDANQNNPSF